MADTVEKVGSPDQWSDNRIRLGVSLNPYCPFGPAFESMLRRDPLKIFFQHGVMGRLLFLETDSIGSLM
jgi:hypothetical protein